MRRLLLTSLAVLALSFAPGLRAEKAQQPEPGYAGLKWGDGPTQDMELVDGKPDAEATYRKKQDPGEVGGVATESVRYVFWKGRLMMVGLHGTHGFAALLDSLAQSWGPGYQSDAKERRYTWTSEGPTGRTIAGLDLENATGYYLTLFSEELTDGMEVEQAMKGTSAAR
jgi:hypothetical protein